MLRFRKLKSFHYDYLPCPKFYDGNNFSDVQSVVLPTHDEFNLGDLLEAGIKVPPVSTSVFHDESSINNIPNLVLDNSSNI